MYTGFGVCKSGCTSFCWTKTGCIFDVCQSGCTHALMQDRTYKEKRPCGGLCAYALVRFVRLCKIGNIKGNALVADVSIWPYRSGWTRFWDRFWCIELSKCSLKYEPSVFNIITNVKDGISA